jgi:poly-gamma-glutamate capsule biosynthesis protein CapA/YwtB (metallophosphatase superfamily)
MHKGTRPRSRIRKGDLVAGAHPPVIQGVEVYGAVLICDSLNNVAFDSRDPARDRRGSDALTLTSSRQCDDRFTEHPLAVINLGVTGP